MKELSNKKMYIIMTMNVIAFIAIAFSVTFAYFQSTLNDDDATISLSGGKLSVSVGSTYSSTSSTPVLMPINAGSEDTSNYAFRHTFTVQRSNDSSLAVCYDVKMTVSSISSSLVSNNCTNNGSSINCGQFIKYKASDGVNTINGDFSSITSGSTITLLSNQRIEKNVTSAKSYTMTMWLENSTTSTVNQLPMLVDNNLSINGYLSVVGTSCQ